MKADLDVFIPFYSCEESKTHLMHLLHRCLDSAEKEGVDRLYVIDGSLQPIQEHEVDAPIIRNPKHGLASAINIAIEHADDDLLLVTTGSLLGVGTIRNMVLEKEEAEKKYGCPVAMLAQRAHYPSEDQWVRRFGEEILSH